MSPKTYTESENVIGIQLIKMGFMLIGYNTINFRKISPHRLQIWNWDIPSEFDRLYYGFVNWNWIRVRAYYSLFNLILVSTFGWKHFYP